MLFNNLSQYLYQNNDIVIDENGNETCQLLKLPNGTKTKNWIRDKDGNQRGDKSINIEGEIYNDWSLDINSIEKAGLLKDKYGNTHQYWLYDHKNMIHSSKLFTTKTGEKYVNYKKHNEIEQAEIFYNKEVRIINYTRKPDGTITGDSVEKSENGSVYKNWFSTEDLEKCDLLVKKNGDKFIN